MLRASSPYSDATDPTSPRYGNMTRLYSRQKWVTLAYTPTALALSHPQTPLVFHIG